ncbi:flagellar basal body rod protein FlgG [Rummeliibacillus sp. G93]|uniref:Flagellar basal-body rod protein FlgG n=1 Tax=Rummeliibacillus stabekisii TaxID=241244 RepID=A0A143HAI3_9BACL|nr:MULTISPECIES: flagellar basal body rod protein FlgG [Rummeliibacillus]AMW98495.1 flagellar basal-body rod protein FlgG [Rummeliibacillus stabekisii]MBB5169876.1 flagellar hook protein FlgE [Rummeliibacillus stabekisii]MCM3315820.1 flagellar basal body rod protein FlgG [Rummeliibacillus stabekisii]UQW98387.1 flagellar basal body rod protein FlgG [Rummeliibacillus sp. G93]GEL04134.1 flagellar basal-body rod protein FlgG [Rummeliibacillus stabekisii]
MLRSMYSGISGLKNFQTKLDVIGNNIANVNTYGFKKGRVVFKDLISQTTQGATAPGDNLGGVNPKQVGLGSQIATIDTIHDAGSMQTTGRTLDVAIAGDGYFVVKDGENEYYTRAGNFYLDSNGTLVTGDGKKVEVGGEVSIPTTATQITIGKDGTVSYMENNTLVQAGQIQIARFANPAGLTKVGGNYFQASNNSGEAQIGNPNEEGRGTVESSFLEMSNVDLSEEFTEMIVAQRGFQANSRIITTSDEILQELVNLKR